MPNPKRANQLPAFFAAAAPSDGFVSFCSVEDFVGALVVIAFTPPSTSSSSISLICAGVAAAGPGVVHVAGTSVKPLSYALAVAQICALDS